VGGSLTIHVSVPIGKTYVQNGLKHTIKQLKHYTFSDMCPNIGMVGRVPGQFFSFEGFP